jgi:hypothetical protein
MLGARSLKANSETYAIVKADSTECVDKMNRCWSLKVDRRSWKVTF